MADRTLQELLSFQGITLADVEEVRLILRGTSVVDWYRLPLETADEVASLLRVNGFDLAVAADLERVRHLLDSAAEYLENAFLYHFPQELRSPASPVDVFLMAASRSEYQPLACTLLKVAHIVNHIEARELRFRLPASEDTIFRRTEEAVVRVMDELIAAGAPVTSFKGGRKSRYSLLTKVLAKKYTIAAPIFDRLRFRIVTRTTNDILPILVHLKGCLFPFNYVVPGQSRNDILPSSAIVDALPSLASLAPQLQYQYQIEEAEDPESVNRYSGSEFRMLNFIADMPLRVDDLVAGLQDSRMGGLGTLVYSVVEFQMFDQATWESNERGENSHERYKDRQKWDVVRRLMYGAGPGGLTGRPGGPGPG